jgi:hypothetical protein
MTILNCEKHGQQPGEKVSKTLFNEFKDGHDLSQKIRDFSFVIEDYECPFYGVQEEIGQLPELCTGGNFIVQSDQRLDEVLGRITVMCLSCLKDAMKGALLPVRDSGP